MILKRRVSMNAIASKPLNFSLVLDSWPFRNNGLIKNFKEAQTALLLTKGLFKKNQTLFTIVLINANNAGFTI
jgi:hypothetical protein